MGICPMRGGGGERSVGRDDIHDPKGDDMNARLTLPNRLIITPAIAVLMVVAFAAALALGFGLRAWTESSAAAPATAVTHARPASEQALVMRGRPW
jgi:hypothetical protein